MATSSSPPPASSDHPSDRHRLEQTGLALTVSQALSGALSVVDVHNLHGTLPDLRQAVAAVVANFAPASAVLSVRHYTQARLDAGIREPFRPVPADSPPLEAIGRAVNWAAQPLWGPAPDPVISQARVEAAAERLVLNTGRQTIVDNVQRDRKARAWAREAKPGACAFCSLLATRGAVYRSADTAGARRNKGFKGDGLFKFHDNCRCVAVPVFGQYEPTAQARQWQKEHADLKAKYGAVSLNLWRQHIEGRIPADSGA